ncbi:MAG: glycosyltransferase [Syntrophobacterales bacterium]|jgi:glycosyltransferase involved in cell wall biosynthesis
MVAEENFLLHRSRPYRSGQYIKRGTVGVERLKILFITAWYPTKERPLVGVFVREHAKAVGLYDNVVVLNCAGRDPNLKNLWRMEQETDESLTHGIPTYRVWYRPSTIPKIWYATYLWGVFQAFRSIVAKGFRPDIIHAHVYEAAVPAVLIGKAYRIPVVVTEHSTGFPMRRLPRQDVRMARFAFSKADMVLPVSLSLQKAIENHGVKARFQIVPNAVDSSLFYPSLDSRLDNRPKRLLFVGLLDPSHKKGLPLLLSALASLKEHRADWCLDLVGDGPARQEYERMAADLGLVDKIIFRGFKTKEEVGELMRQADIFVLPSLFETFSVVAAEALVSGLPVLATRCGGPEEFITDDVGVLVPPGDAKVLGQGLDHMLDDLSRFSADRISHYATNRFSHNRVGVQLHNIYLNLKGSTIDTFEVGCAGERIGIEKHWRVLDIGSGHNPHRRANILLDKNIHSSIERSGRTAVRDDRPFVIGDAQYLPFKAKCFDYVIASQVAEHALDPIAFCKEIQRVASRGYIECPGLLGELLLGEPFHFWVVLKKGKSLLFKKKTENSGLLQIISNMFYAIFYVNGDRARWTLQPKSKVLTSIFSTLSWFIGKFWRSRILRPLTYTSFEFEGKFDVKVLF